MRGGGEGDLKNDAAHVAEGLAFLDVLFRVSGFRGKTSKRRCCISRIWRSGDGLAFLDVLFPRLQVVVSTSPVLSHTMLFTTTYQNIKLTVLWGS